jgi:hypothetical protein
MLNCSVKLKENKLAGNCTEKRGIGLVYGSAAVFA